MNWTGGNLHKQKKAGRGAVTKQKQHFANTRTKLRNGSDSLAQFKPSFIPRELGSVTPIKGQIRSSRSQGRQTKLEDYREIAPLVKKLSSLAPKSHESFAHTVQTILSSKDINAGQSPRADRQIFDTEKYVFTGSASPSSISAPSQNRRESFDISTAAADSTALALQYKRRTQLPNKENRRESDRLEDHERKRRELLGRVDWMGLDTTKPLQMDFMSDRGKEQVAKRRRINDLDNPGKQGAIHGRMRLPSIGERPEDFTMSGALNPGRLLQNGTIRIRIGDDALKSQTDAMSKVGSQKTRTLSPESILLHENGELEARQLLDHRRSLSDQSEASIDIARGSLRASASPTQDNGSRHAQDPASAYSSQYKNVSSECAPTQFAVCGSATGSDSSHHAEYFTSQVRSCALAEGEQTWRELLRVYDREEDENKAQNGRKYGLTTSPDKFQSTRHDRDPESHRHSKHTSDDTTSEYRAQLPVDEVTRRLVRTDVKSQTPRKDLNTIWKALDYGSSTESLPSYQDRISELDIKGPTSSMRVQIPPSPYEFVGQSSRTHQASNDSNILMLATAREKERNGVHRTREATGWVDQKQKRSLRHELSASTPSSTSQGQIPSSLSFDRPSSVANASITAAVLFDNQFARDKVQKAKGLSRESGGKTGGQMKKGVSTCRRPNPTAADSNMDEGSGSWCEDGFLQDDILDSD